MQHKVVTLRPDTPLSEVARVLWDEQVSGVPIVDRNNHPLGFVSVSDIVRYQAFGLQYQPPAAPVRAAGLTKTKRDIPAPGMGTARHVGPREGEVRARDVMTAASYTVGPSTTVLALAKFLVTAGIHHALVMERSELVGIVSAFDIVQDLAEHAPVDEELESLPQLQAVDVEC